MLTQERLKELLSYDPATGDFTWKIQSGNRISVGMVAGTIYGLIRVINVENATDEEKIDLLVDNLSWGYLGGVAVGLLIGIYEGPTIADEYSSESSIKLATGFLRDSRDNAVPSLNLGYKF